MTDLAQALADSSHLSDFEGLAVRQAGVELPKAAGGLQEAMKIEPREIHQGDEGTIALSYTCQKVRFEPIDKDAPDGDQRRVHVLQVTGAAFIDSDVVNKEIADQSERIQRAKEEAKGISRLALADGDEEQEDALAEAHDNGDHAEGLVAGCPYCREEADLEAEGL